MATDIRLDEGQDGNLIILEGSVLKATTYDFELDSPGRRKPSKGGRRRALVHDPQDGLTINWGNDYPGGVTINDVVALHNSRRGIVLQGVREIGGFSLAPAHSGTGAAGTASSHTGHSLILRGNIMIEANPIASTATSAGHSAAETVSLQQTILELHAKIERLSEQVVELQKRSQERFEHA